MEFTRSQPSCNLIMIKDYKPFNMLKTRRPERCEKKGKGRAKIVKKD
jgi:hypothetical protein